MISSLENSRQNNVMDQPRRSILAHPSRKRRELLASCGRRFETAGPDCDESALPGEAAPETALRLSLLKARSVAPRFANALIIGSDQVASSEGRPLGKPGNHETATRQLRSLSGKSADFHTAVSLLDSRNNEPHSRRGLCRVVFRKLDEQRIEAYLRREQPYDCAGSAKAEGLGIV